MMNSFFIFIIAGITTSQSSNAGELDPVSFMQGCWGTTNQQKQNITEDWQAPTTEIMLGISQTVQHGSMTEYEFLEIKWDGIQKKITYTPFLNGKKLNTFSLDNSASVANSATFTDLKNPTLQKIHYSLKSPKILNVHLSGNSKDGKSFEYNFNLNRENCERKSK